MRDLYGFIRKNTLTAAAFGKNKELYALKIDHAQKADGRFFAATSEGKEAFRQYVAGSILIGYGGSAAFVPELYESPVSFGGTADLLAFAKELAADSGEKTDLVSQLRRFEVAVPQSAPQYASAIFALLFAYAREQRFRAYLECIGGLKSISVAVGGMIAEAKNFWESS